MDEKQEKLLTERGVLVLPQEIEHETYEVVLEALLIAAGKEVRLHCNGDGGNSRAALAMVDLIRQHGQVTGLLAGMASSSHGVIWAGCTRRFVYPMGCIGLHMVGWNAFNSRIDSVTAAQIAHEYDAGDRQNAEVFAAASIMPCDYWYKLLRDTGSGHVVTFEAVKLIEMGMARPVSELG